MKLYQLEKKVYNFNQADLITKIKSNFQEF